MTAGWPVWWPSTRRSGRRIWGTIGLSTWPWCWGRSWWSGVPLCGTGRTNRGSGPASMDVERQVLLDRPDYLIWPGDLPSAWGKGCGLAYLCYRKAFPTTVSRSILWEKLAAQGVDKCTLYWVQNQDCWAQKVNGVTHPAGDSHEWRFLKLRTGTNPVHFLYWWSKWGCWVHVQ